MASGEPYSGEDESEEKILRVLKVFGILVVALFALAFLSPKPKTEFTEQGVEVVSEIPLERFEQMNYIALYNTTKSPEELTCKFELSAISTPDIRGYRISIGEGDTGIHLKEKEAEIRGKSPAELLTACHVFACLREGIQCPNFILLENFLNSAESMSVIIDEDVGSVGARGYAEIIGVLSYVQSQRADTDGDNLVTQEEVDANEFFIYPFTMRDGVCTPQPLNNLVQNWSATNETYDCANIAPAIVLTPANDSSITVLEDQVVVMGGDEDIRSASIILRDIISPKWIRTLYKMN